MESKSGKVKLVILFSLLGAVAIPIAVFYIFQFIFVDYYESNILLPGIGHVLMSGVMIILNLFLFPIANVKNYKKIDMVNSSREDDESFVFKTTMIVAGSALVQSVLSIVVENPF
ncbi:hypothetical protein [Paenibacillus sp. NPDC057967]|uniref:hypothetical protein n=1 Tax=Paenibacillus sp. NPDC057967 TaxID=3346293 RepID=UPI0036DED43B